MQSQQEVSLPSKLYRGLLMLTASWPGARVDEKSLLIHVHQSESASKLPLIWCGGPPELPFIINEIGHNRDIYGLRGTYDFVEPTDDVIKRLGAYYANEIEKSIPSDTYVIAGYCAAAYIAHEIATLLTNKGYKIGFLGMIERDVTEKNKCIHLFRKIFNRLDTYGTRYREAMESINKPRTFTNTLQNSVFLFRKIFLAKHIKEANDPRDQIRYEGDTEQMYHLAPYQGRVSLFFIRWGVFGFYQLPYFQQYWKRVALKGITVDFIPGYSHKYPDWVAITKQLNKRLIASGF